VDNNNKEWTLVISKKHIEKSNKHNKCETVSTGYLTTTSNRFTMLHNLEDNQTDPKEGQECSEWTSSTKCIWKINKQHNPGIRIPTIINGRIINSENRNPTLVTKKSSHVADFKCNNIDHTVRIIDDSHLRYCSKDKSVSKYKI
jgi:hypothetical protein